MSHAWREGQKDSGVLNVGHYLDQQDFHRSTRRLRPRLMAEGLNPAQRGLSSTDMIDWKSGDQRHRRWKVGYTLAAAGSARELVGHTTWRQGADYCGSRQGGRLGFDATDTSCTVYCIVLMQSVQISRCSRAILTSRYAPGMATTVSTSTQRDCTLEDLGTIWTISNLSVSSRTGTPE